MAKSIATIEITNLTLAALSKNFKTEILASACRLYILVTLIILAEFSHFNKIKEKERKISSFYKKIADKNNNKKFVIWRTQTKQ